MTTAPARGQLRRARHLRVEDLLTVDEHQALLAYAADHEHDLSRSTIARGEEVAGPTVELDPGLRRSRTLHHLDDVISAMFEPTLRAMLPAARQELGVPWFRLGTIERQLHVHGPGDFFGVHVDNGTGATAGRLVSAVYYFHETPRRFTGGSLWLYDQFDVGGRLYTAPRRTVIEPSDNSLVIFPSSVPHEIEPVRSASDAYRSSRFSITFWFRVTEDGADLGDRRADRTG